MRILRLVGTVLVGVVLAAGVRPALAAPRVVATVAPVHSLVAGVMVGVGEPYLLIRAGASPHDFVLRPSDRRALEEAQLVFRVGEGLEGFLDRTLAALPRKARVIDLEEAPGTVVLEVREGGVWAEDEHGHEAEGHGSEARDEPRGAEQHAAEAHDGEAHHDSDPHYWLDPVNAMAWTAAIAEALSAADPESRVRYAENAAALLARLHALEAELRAALAPVRERPYVVFHDGYQYFEKRFGLNAVGSISVSDARAPGVRRLAELRAVIRERRAVCVFAEPQFEPRLVGTVIEGSTVRSAELDPLGASLKPGPELYFDLMREMAKSLQTCLGR